VNNTTIPYSAVGLTTRLIGIFLGLIVCPLLLDVMSVQAMQRGQTQAVYFLIGCSLILIAFFPFVFLLFKSFLALTRKSPAIELTPDFYIDHMEGVKVSWNDISNIFLRRSRTDFLVVSVLDNSIVYRQKKPIYRVMFWINTLSGGILSINMGILSGENQDIVNIIKDYLSNVAHKHEGNKP
jgi:uncharacterized membrane protein YesL